MANKNIMDLAENTSPATTAAVEIDDGVTSEYVTIANLVNSIVGNMFSNNSADIYRVDSSGVSDFVATIASISGNTLVYNAPSNGNEASIKPVSSGQLAKLRIYNTSNAPVDYLLVSSVDTSTNTITFTSAVPGTWAVGETITSRSQTNTNTVGGAYFQDIEITSGVVDKSGLFIYVDFGDSGGAGQSVRLAPFATYADGATFVLRTQSTSNSSGVFPIVITSNVFTLRWSASGAATAFTILRLAGSVV